jgi:3-isopropylmalate/(R)-2-methylmalate dehydratase small subunit
MLVGWRGAAGTLEMRVWRLGADIDTDQLAPGATMKFGLEVTARHCLEGVRPDFAAGVRRGDVIVAGAHFGIGSSREQAASVLVHLGLAAVIAPSFAGLYLRNAFNVGLLLLTCPRADVLADGETLAFDARAGHITRADGRVLGCDPIPGFLLDMVEAGGLLPQLKKRFKERP